MGRKRSLAIGTVLVAGAGYVAGLLTAPKSGKQTRKDLQRKALKAKTEAERKLKVAHSDLNQLLDETSAFTKTAKGKALTEIEKTRHQAEQVRQKSRELLSAIHEGEADDKDLQKSIDDVKKAADHLKKYLGKKSTKD